MVLGRWAKKTNKTNPRQKTLHCYSVCSPPKFSLFFTNLSKSHILFFSLWKFTFSLSLRGMMMEKELLRTSGASRNCRVSTADSASPQKLTEGCPERSFDSLARPCFPSFSDHPSWASMHLVVLFLNMYVDQVPISAYLPKACRVAILLGNKKANTTANICTL